MKNIQMVDLTTQYETICREMDDAILNTVRSGKYINGPQVDRFAGQLSSFTGARYVIPCANGTDALQIALMALNLRPGDEVIIPAFTYAAAIEVAILLGLAPILVDVDPLTYNIDPERIIEAISSKTKAVIPVHLFGHTCHMDPIKKLCRTRGIHIIEDNAQSIGAVYTFPDGKNRQAGTIGDIGTLSFFPSKNLGCYGDGGAILTDDEGLAEKLRMIATHGQQKKYRHEIIGCNSRLDTLQAAVLEVKLKYLEAYIKARQQAAAYYEEGLHVLKEHIETPCEMTYSTHVFHQYTIQVKKGKRDSLQRYLKEHDIPSMVYYPVPLQKQNAFRNVSRIRGDLEITNRLCESVLSLPMHTELDIEQQDYIIHTIKEFFQYN